MKNEELKHSIDNGLSMITSILGEEDHFEHYNHNHDALGRFASTPGGAKYEKKLDKIQTKIDSNNSKIEGYKKKINPRKKIKAEKLRTKSTKYEKANKKAKIKEIKGKEVSDRLAKKANKHSELNTKADLIDSKNIKLEQKISELEAKNEKYQAQIDKVLSKMEKTMTNKISNAELSERLDKASEKSKYFKNADTGFGGDMRTYSLFLGKNKDINLNFNIDLTNYPKDTNSVFKTADKIVEEIKSGDLEEHAKDIISGDEIVLEGSYGTSKKYLNSCKMDLVDVMIDNEKISYYTYLRNKETNHDWLVEFNIDKKGRRVPTEGLATFL